MNTQQIAILLLGFIAYWSFKLSAVYKKTKNGNAVLQYLKSQIFEIVFSLSCVAFLAISAKELTEYIALDKPISIFIAGGAFPSMVKNVAGIWKE